MLYYLYLATLIQSLAAAKHLHHALADWSLKSAGPRLVILSTNFGDHGCSQFAGRAQQVGSHRHLMDFSSRQRRLPSLSDWKSWDPCFVLPNADGWYSGQAGKWLSKRLWVKRLLRSKWLSKSTLTHHLCQSSR